MQKQGEFFLPQQFKGKVWEIRCHRASQWLFLDLCANTGKSQNCASFTV
jgi:hypothetical protein